MIKFDCEQMVGSGFDRQNRQCLSSARAKRRGARQSERCDFADAVPMFWNLYTLSAQERHEDPRRLFDSRLANMEARPGREIVWLVFPRRKRWRDGFPLC